MEYHGGNRYPEVLPYEVMWDIVLDKLKLIMPVDL